MKRYEFFLFSFVTLIFFSVSPLFSQNKIIQVYWNIKGDTIRFIANNNIPCPVSVSLDIKKVKQKENLLYKDVLILPKGKAGVFVKTVGDSSTVNELFSQFIIDARMGDVNDSTYDTNYVYLPPFLQGKTYKITQGYNGRFSHRRSIYSKYSIDLDLKEGDTICASRAGIVCQIRDTFNVGGVHDSLKDKSNLISIYHKDGTIGQYVHLKPNGVVVSIGDTIKAGQIIGFSGNTGYTSGAHLHFSILLPKRNRTESIPIKIFGFNKAMKRGRKITHSSLIE